MQISDLVARSPMARVTSIGSLMENGLDVHSYGSAAFIILQPSGGAHTMIAMGRNLGLKTIRDTSSDG